MSDENKYFDAEGNEVDGVLTAEEVERKLEEAQTKAEEETSKQLEEYQKESDQEREEMSKELEETKIELEKERGKERNFSNLRKSKEEGNGKIEELTKKVEELSKGIETSKNEANDQMTTSAIKIKAGSDKELEGKIKFHFDTFTKPQNVEELKERVESAFILATGGQQVDALTGNIVSSASGASEPSMPAEGVGKGHKLSEAGKTAGKGLGITDKDYELAKKRGIIK